MKNRRISRQTFAIRTADDTSRPGEILRTLLAVTMAVGLIATGAIALPSLSPADAAEEIQPVTVAQLEPQVLADIEGLHEQASMLGAPLRESVSSMAKAIPA